MLSQAAEKQTANWPASVSVLGGTGVGELELGWGKIFADVD